ncbi:MAG: Holliday junction branch migration DNA helicase RuvB [Nannocystaceae bacterium]
MVRIPHAEPPQDSVSASPSQVEKRAPTLTSPERTDEDADPGPALRPARFSEYIGQRDLIDKMQVYVDAARQRGDALDHVLLHGPPGLGKTTLAQILAAELDVQLHVTSGPAIEHKGVLAALLTSLGTRDMLFIDEIHRLPPAVEESLYSAMEDRRIDLPVGEGSRARTMSFQLPPFTLAGATTRTALLSAPLRDRFNIIEGLVFYADADLANIVARAAQILGVPTTSDGAHEIGRRSRGTPRIAIRLTRRIRDFVQVGPRDGIDLDGANEYLERLGVDAEGLDALDRRLLTTIITLFSGGPVGIDALAASLGEPRDTLEDVHEPFLLQRGFVIRSPRGRIATERAEAHLRLGKG